LRACASDRSAQLETELAEARAALKRAYDQGRQEGFDLERAAHALTQATIAAMEHDRDLWQGLASAVLTGDVPEAMTNILQALGLDVEDYKEHAHNREFIDHKSAGRAAVGAIARTQAEAAAMRVVLRAAAELLPTGKLDAAISNALAGDAGRAIAEHVPLWRELETLVRSLSGDVIPVGCLIDVVLRKLAALDEKPKETP